MSEQDNQEELQDEMQEELQEELQEKTQEKASKTAKSKKGKKTQDAPSFPKRIMDVLRTYRGEFSKIVWPDRPEMLRKTTTVVVISLLFGVYIAILDGILGSLFSLFVEFMFM